MASTSCEWYFILILGFFLSTSTVQAQEKEKEKIQELEQLNAARKQTVSVILLDSAVLLMQRGAYEKAEEIFIEVLKSVKTVPSELAYFFGENSYHLKKYRQSIDWLTKYIQLKGTTGAFSGQASSFLKLSEDALRTEINLKQKEATEVLSRDYDIDCGPLGKVVCPVCGGRTVIVKKNYLSETFTTCNFCDEHGFLSCSDYNKLLRGQLKGRTTK